MPPKKNDAQDRMFAAFWSTSLRKLITTLTLISACVTATGGAWAFLDLPIPATRMYVHESVGPIKLVQSQQSVSIDRFLLFQLQDSLDKANKDPGAKTSDIVQQRIRDLEKQIKDTQARIDKSGG